MNTTPEFQWTPSVIILVIFIALIFVVPIVFRQYRQKNIFSVMVLYFIVEPLAFTVFGLFILTILTRGNEHVIFIAMFLLVPIGCILWLLLDHRDINFLKRAKIALEWNQAIATGVSIVVAILIFLTSNSELQFIDSLFPVEILEQDGLDFRDASNFLILIISFPFVIGFTLSKAYIEHLIFRSEVNEGRKLKTRDETI